MRHICETVMVTEDMDIRYVSSVGSGITTRRIYSFIFHGIISLVSYVSVKGFNSNISRTTKIWKSISVLVISYVKIRCVCANVL